MGTVLTLINITRYLNEEGTQQLAIDTGDEHDAVTILGMLTMAASFIAAEQVGKSGTVDD